MFSVASLLTRKTVSPAALILVFTAGRISAELLKTPTGNPNTKLNDPTRTPLGESAPGIIGSKR